MKDSASSIIQYNDKYYLLKPMEGDDIMSKAINYQLSIFGKFSIIPTPDTVASLMTKINQTTQKTMLPNMITSQQIEIPSNRISAISNLGFITQDQMYSIAILNDRIDVTYNRVDEKGVSQEDFYAFAVNVLSVIIDNSNIVANRLAANIQFICAMSDFNVMYAKGKELLKNAAYYDNKDYSEWSLRTNALDSINIIGSDEGINVITDISSAQDPTGKALIAFHIDINTFPQNTNSRFGKDALEPFVSSIIPIASNIAADMERLIIHGQSDYTAS